MTFESIGWTFGDGMVLKRESEAFRRMTYYDKWQKMFHVEHFRNEQIAILKLVGFIQSGEMRKWIQVNDVC